MYAVETRAVITETKQMFEVIEMDILKKNNGMK
jgi:hypothetical protein